MTVIELLHHQTQDAYQWMHKLIASVPEERWDEIPTGLTSNISWQIGHLVISIYYHSVIVIKGHQEDILTTVPIQNYAEAYGLHTTPATAIGKSTVADLKKHMAIVEKKSLDILNSLSVNELETALVPGPVKHPVAKTKLEAIDWNIKHTMWHCGQLASIKRALGDPHSFELKKEDS